MDPGRNSAADNGEYLPGHARPGNDVATWSFTGLGGRGVRRPNIAVPLP